MSTLKQTRKRLGLTQKQMGLILGCSQHRISEIETGVRSMTKKTRHHLVAVEVIYDNGLWAELFAQLKPIKQL